MPNTCINYEKKCGGCPLLALPYREQLAKKQARLQELLGGFAPVKAVQGMAEPLHYRNKAIASFATQRGKLRLRPVCRGHPPRPARRGLPFAGGNFE